MDANDARRLVEVLQLNFQGDPPTGKRLKEFVQRLSNSPATFDDAFCGVDALVRAGGRFLPSPGEVCRAGEAALAERLKAEAEQRQAEERAEALRHRQPRAAAEYLAAFHDLAEGRLALGVGFLSRCRAIAERYDHSEVLAEYDEQIALWQAGKIKTWHGDELPIPQRAPSQAAVLAVAAVGSKPRRHLEAVRA